MRQSPNPELGEASEQPRRLGRWFTYVVVGVLCVLLLGLFGWSVGWFDREPEDTGGIRAVESLAPEPQDDQQSNTDSGSQADPNDSEVGTAAEEPSTDDAGAQAGATKEACAEHSKICFRIPSDWKSSFRKVTDPDFVRQPPGSKGTIYFEELWLIDQNKHPRIKFVNQYGSPDFTLRRESKYSSTGTIERTVVKYQTVNFQSFDSGFKNNWVVQAVADKIDPEKTDGYMGPNVMYEATIELAPRHPVANKPGKYIIDYDEKVKGSGTMNGLTQPVDYISVKVNSVGAPLTSMDEAVARLWRPESLESFEVVASMHQK